MKKPRILIFDIESSFNEVFCFDTREQDILPDNIVVERYIHCISYQIYGEKKINLISQLDFPSFKKNIHSDYEVCKKFREIISQADIWVAHFGSRFDIKMLNGRLLLNGLEPLPDIPHYDTCLIARKLFKLNYNSLNYLAEKLGIKGKIENSKGLWRRCFEGNVKALKQMGIYNKQDVNVLTKVFEKLMPFIHIHPITPKEAICKNLICQSKNIILKGKGINKFGEYHRFKCLDCGKAGQFKP
jgi:DNA polymerase III epsilon subunit-like protein